MKARFVGAGSSTEELPLYLESFFSHLSVAGYAKRTLRKKRSVLKAFSRWMRAEQLDLPNLTDTKIADFVGRLPKERRERIKLEWSTLRPLAEYLRATFGLPACEPQHEPLPESALLSRYVDYLRKDRGLAENSVLVYAPLIKGFLTDQASRVSAITPSKFDPQTVQEFLLGWSRSRSSQCVRLTATALRSFFRFLLQTGQIDRDLSVAVPTVRKWGQLPGHFFLSPQEVKAALSSPDLSTQRGRRDLAILLLLARLGLRAGEVVALELNDIHWRAGEFVVRGKGRVRVNMPLLADVGEALATYLRLDRCHKTTSTRRVFLRLNAPHACLAGPAAVAHIVRYALSQAGLQQPRGCSSHLFRHSLATQMIRQGASLAEISEVLRHHSQSTTTLYTQVSFGALREVARPWPVIGGGE